MSSSLTPETIAKLLQPYIAAAPPQSADWPHIHTQLATYLELLVKWNAKTNLTAIREPEEIVRRHFGESLFVGAHLNAKSAENHGERPTLLDFGSGAGLPGIPIQLLRPDIAVTLAESQGKKAAFLREAVRTLGLTAEVWAARVESMPPERRFGTVVLRAVDDMDAAVAEAARRAHDRVLILTTTRQFVYYPLADSFRLADPIPLPESNEGVLLVANRT